MSRALSRAAIAASGLILGLSACATVPGAGPRAGAIERAADRFAVIDLTPAVTETVATFVARQHDEGPVTLPSKRSLGVAGPGDQVKLVIWQPNPTGVTTTADKPALELETRIGMDGTIGVPYAGRMHVAGQTPSGMEAAIAARLADQMPGAQVAVLVTDDVTNNVIIQGEVNKPGRYQVVPGKSGLLDLLAQAGATHAPERQTMVRVTRGGTSFTRALSTIMDTHALEADLAPGDRILVQPRPRFFYAFGAVSHPGEQAYDADDMTLAHMLARLHGLSDTVADPASVFIYRRQPPALTRQLTASAAADQGRVIYRLNLRDAGGFFIAQEFPVLPDDVLYVSDAPIAEAAKVFQVLTGVSGLGAIPRNLGAPY